MKRYIEFSFYLPFFDLIDDTDGVFSLEELMRQLNIRFNIMELYNQYLSYGEGVSRVGKGDVFVFSTKYDKNIFILIDLFNDFTDQHNMVKLGVRCEINHDKRIRDIFNNIHLRAEIKSKINESDDDLLKLDINSEDYPKEVPYGDHIYIKNIYYNTI
ncbi:hypothetical protein GMA19_03334 [Paenibacillus polymyxa E681]|uniref:hypothetical protein n=1 Tax=Paenibacillus polymyxa TaxID=1406 RepID=UPI0001E320B2|nr:hypothetical protein [Paenibacillus polymyxa]ADM71139.1 hypothetical protein PPE_03321 [Paenibacillus polymyxa E681]QNV58161.1 hypothetical protein GE561_03334 [Paenibacillus polymyxa E681]QNV62998.1 hypothetical protein GMA19_03334 [Paenibacillus polymyxa E681]